MFFGTHVHQNRENPGFFTIMAADPCIYYTFCEQLTNRWIARYVSSGASIHGE